MNNVSSSDVIVTPPSQTQPGLLATAVPHSIPAKPRKVCTLSPSLMTVNVVVFCDVMMSLRNLPSAHCTVSSEGESTT